MKTWWQWTGLTGQKTGTDAETVFPEGRESRGSPSSGATGSVNRGGAGMVHREKRSDSVPCLGSLLL